MKTIILLLLGFFTTSLSSRVIELSDRFLDYKKDGYWLVMFYAPWCAHCKRLEPVWLHVAQSLYNTNVRVGRIDCTRYTSVAQHFSISGFPTVMFVKGDDKEFVFRGERSKEEIVNFAHRLAGPPVQQVTRKESFNLLQDTRNVFFMYAGPYTGQNWEMYYAAAEKYQPYAFFYATPQELMQEHLKKHSSQDINTNPAIFVYKDKSYYPFEVEGNTNLNGSLYEWINVERFETFVKVTRNNINQIMQTNKNLALAVVAENVLEEIPEDMITFKEMVEAVIKENRDKYHRHYQFGWIGNPDLANSIAMKEIELPHLMVINSSTNHHHIPEWHPKEAKVSHASIISFLDAVLLDTAPKYGGNAWHIRGYRMYYDTVTALSEMWKGNPILTSVLFGLPLGFLSLILYSTCCADIMDANEEEEDLGFSHEKKE